MKDLIVKYTGQLDEDEEVLGCGTCCRPPARVYKRDGAWSWVVCVAGVLSNVIILGIAFTFGIIFPTLLDEFKEGKAKTAFMGSLAVAATGIFGPVAGKLVDRFGCRMVTFLGALICAVGLLMTSQAPNIAVMYVTYSVIFGFGASCANNATVLVVPKYFKKWLSFAIGLVSAGPGGGVFIMSPIVQALMDKFGWRGAYMGQAGLCVIVGLLACTFEPNVEDDEREYKVRLKEVEAEHYCSKSWIQTTFNFNFPFLRNPLFVIFTVSSAVNFFGMSIPTVHMARHSEDLGISADRTSQLYFYYGLTSMLSRVATGQLCNTGWVSPETLYRAAILIGNTATLVVPIATTYNGLLAYLVVFGFSEGAVATPLNITLLSSLSPRQRAQGYGFSMLVVCTALGIGPAFAGFLADKFDSYDIPFYVAGSISLFSIFITFFLFCFKPPDAKVLVKEKSSSQEELLVIEKISVL